VERVEAEAIHEARREAVVEVLLAMDRRIVQLEARVEKLDRRLARNSGTPPVRQAQIRRGDLSPEEFEKGSTTTTTTD
jgi:predicted nucleic acid-binding Zn ribbon protein